MACFIPFIRAISATIFLFALQAEASAQSLLQLPTNRSLPLNQYDFTYNTKDPLVTRTTTPAILDYFGYPYQNYTVTSADGYEITLFRILPRPSSASCSIREPVLIQHGLLSSSADWLCQDSDRNLPLILTDSCFDVWLANARGTTYSRGHTFLNSSTDPAYWDFSFDEMGNYDVPAMIDFVLANSGNGTQTFTKLNYIGHSMGNALFFICMHYHPEYNAKIRKYVSLAPAAYVGNLTSPVLRTGALIPPPAIEGTFDSISKGELGVDSVYYLMHQLSPIICPYEVLTDTLCAQLYYSIGGWSNQPLNSTVVTRLFTHFPDTSSANTVAHYSQNVRSAKFESLAGYASLKNLTLDELYKPAVSAFYSANNATLSSVINNTATGTLGLLGSILQPATTSTPTTTTSSPVLIKSPVQYNLNNTNVDLMVIVGEQDSLATVKDVMRTIAAIGTVNATERITVIPMCDHFDIILMDSSKQKVFIPALNYLLINMPTTIQ